MKQIILASGSPRRKKLLENVGLKFKIIESNFKEYFDNKLSPNQLAKKLSLEKAKAVWENHKDSIIIAADTLVVCEGKILGKPIDENDAKKMLSFLSGKSHVVITGFTIINGLLGKIVTKSEDTKVYMRKISSSEINSYIKTGEPFDKAGAYAIQGISRVFIEKIEGDFDNAVGLPISSIMVQLKNFGVEID